MTEPPPFGAAVIERTKRNMWRCKVCRRTGPPGGAWAKLCIAGHTIVCVCGRTFTTVHHRGAHVAKQRCYDQPKEKT